MSRLSQTKDNTTECDTHFLPSKDLQPWLGGEMSCRYEKVMSVQDLGKVTDHIISRSEQNKNP